MVDVDIAQLVREALLASGCDQDKISGFDGHSTISLNFSDHPSILISYVDGQVWIWTRLIEDLGTNVMQCSEQLLEKLMTGCQFAATGQLQLATNEGYLELKGMVHPNYLESGERFAEALEEFFNLMDMYLGIFR